MGAAAGNGEIERAQGAIVDVLAPLIDASRPVALVDFPDAANAGDHAIWLGEKALLARLGAQVAYQCSAATYDAAAMAAQLGGGQILVHGGVFSDLYPAGHDFRLRVLRDFPDNNVIMLPQTVMFFAEEALRQAAGAVAAHGKVTLIARDVLSLHVLHRHFGGAARVALAPDMAFMLGRVTPAGAKNFNVVWVARTDMESLPAGTLAEATGLQPRTVSADLGAFADGIPTSAEAEAVGEQLLATDWRRITAKEPGLAAYAAHGFDARSLFWVQRAVRLMSAGRVVVTDRLHGHILGVLAGVPHVLLNSGYGKNAAYFETWPAPEGLAQLAATPKHAWSLAQQTLALQQEVAPARIDLAAWLGAGSAQQVLRRREERAAHHVRPGARVFDAKASDLSAGARPSLDDADHVMALGVLEAVVDPDGFWAWLAGGRARVILAYPVLTPSFPAANRRAAGWRNDFTRAEILALADRAGFDLAAEEASAPDNILFVFDRRAPSAAAESQAAPGQAQLK